MRYHSIISVTTILGFRSSSLTMAWCLTGAHHLDGVVSENIVLSAHSVQGTAPAIIAMEFPGFSGHDFVAVGEPIRRPLD